MGSVLAPETDMIFGDGVGASFVRGPRSEHGDAFRAAEEVAWVGLNPTSEKAPDSTCWVQFWTLVKETHL